MSQQQSQESPWIWSQSRQQWYYHDRQSNHYVLQDGTRFDVPRAMEAQSGERLTRNPQDYQQPPFNARNAQQPPFNLQSYRPPPGLEHPGQSYYDGYTTAPHARHSSSSPSTGESSTNQLAANLGALHVGDRQRPRVITTRRQGSSGYITEAFDTKTNVKTVYQTEPKDKITEVSVLRDGGLARRKLEPTSDTTDTTEKLDPSQCFPFQETANHS